MRKLKNNLILFNTSFAYNNIIYLCHITCSHKLVNGSNATDKIYKKSEETSQTENPFFFPVQYRTSSF